VPARPKQSRPPFFGLRPPLGMKQGDPCLSGYVKKCRRRINLLQHERERGPGGGGERAQRAVQPRWGRPTQSVKGTGASQPSATTRSISSCSFQTRGQAGRKPATDCCSAAAGSRQASAGEKRPRSVRVPPPVLTAKPTQVSNPHGKSCANGRGKKRPGGGYSQAPGGQKNSPPQPTPTPGKQRGVLFCPGEAPVAPEADGASWLPFGFVGARYAFKNAGQRGVGPPHELTTAFAHGAQKCCHENQDYDTARGRRGGASRSIFGSPGRDGHGAGGRTKDDATWALTHLSLSINRNLFCSA
jgi:hypothetical protein